MQRQFLAALIGEEGADGAPRRPLQLWCGRIRRRLLLTRVKFLGETRERSRRSEKGRSPRLCAVQAQRGEAGGRRLTEKGGPGPGVICREFSQKPRAGVWQCTCTISRGGTPWI
eukprot:758238-Rhodomonas_salina.2